MSYAATNSFLFPGAEERVCVLRETPISELGLPAQFLMDLQQALPRLSISSLAEDILNGAISRETFHHLFPKGQARYTDARCLSFSVSFAILAAILLRPKPMVRPRRDRHLTKLRPKERTALLQLLHHYGVQCGTGSCCGLVPDPIAIGQEAA